MGRNPQHSEQIRAHNRARRAAVRQLIENHRSEYEEIYRSEAAKVGVTPRWARRGRQRDDSEQVS